MPTRIAAVFALLSLFFLKGGPAHAADLVIKDVRVFDGEKVIGKASVLVRDGKIAAIGDKVPAGKDAKVIDGAGKTLLPGLIDCHCHTYLPQHLRSAVEFGVTTSLDMMTMPAFAKQVGMQQAKNRANGQSDLFSAGSTVTVKGGHGTEYGFVVPVLDSEAGAQDFIDERIAEGSRYIKLIYDDGKPFGINFPTLTKGMLAAAIKAAHERNKLAVVHIGSQQGAIDAVECGADALMHLFAEEIVTEETIALFLKNKTVVVPTMTVLKGVLDSGDADRLMADKQLGKLLTKTEEAALRRSFPKRRNVPSTYASAVASVRKLHKAGVTILAGTDSPNPGTTHGASMHHEMELLTKSGFSPLEALKAATSKAAAAFRFKDRGAIRVGLHADLLLVKGDPAKDIMATRAIVGIWKAGQRIDLEARRKQVEKERSAKPSTGSGDRIISTFDVDGIRTQFGAGFQESTDKMFGGTSTVKFAVAAGGANKTKGSLRITGNVRKQQPAYSGVMFYPGAQPMQPGNVSEHPVLSFYARGEKKPFQVMLFFQKRGFQPSMKSFKVTGEWKHHEYSLSDFDGCDGSDLLGIFFGSSQAGDFELFVDEVKLSAAKAKIDKAAKQ